MFQNVKTVQQQGSLISILTGSSKICLLVRVLCIWFNLCWRFLVPCSPCVISSAVQLYYVLVATIPHKFWDQSPSPIINVVCNIWDRFLAQASELLLFQYAATLSRRKGPDLFLQSGPFQNFHKFFLELTWSQ